MRKYIESLVTCYVKTPNKKHPANKAAITNQGTSECERSIFIAMHFAHEFEAKASSQTVPLVSKITGLKGKERGQGQRRRTQQLKLGDKGKEEARQGQRRWNTAKKIKGDKAKEADTTMLGNKATEIKGDKFGEGGHSNRNWEIERKK